MGKGRHLSDKRGQGGGEFALAEAVQGMTWPGTEQMGGWSMEPIK